MSGTGRNEYEKKFKRRRSRAKRRTGACFCEQWVHRYSEWLTTVGLPMLLNCTCGCHQRKYVVVIHFTANPKDNCAGVAP